MKFTLKHCKLAFKNLGGRPDDYNPAGGKRSFAVVLTEEDADILFQNGVPIKRFIDKATGENKEPYVRVKVNFKTDENGKVTSPLIYLVKEGKKPSEPLTPASAGTVDTANIDFVDMVISSWNYNYAGKSGITVYLDKMYVNIIEDELDKIYAMYGEDDDDEPTEIPFC